MEPAQWELWHAWTQAQRLLQRELDRDLQRDHGISKTEFSVLVTLRRAGGSTRVAELVEALGWEKSRVSHQLTRMESRGLLERAAGRRTTTGLTPEGRAVVDAAVLSHGENVRRHFFDTLTAEQLAAVRTWSEETVARLSP